MAAKTDLTTAKLEKQVFQFKKFRKDGLILQVHHSIPGRDGEIQRVRFTSVVFKESGEQLAAVDHRGNVFVIDLDACKVWLLPSLGICTVVAFSSQSNNTIVMGTTDCILNFMNTETGSVTLSLKGHTLPAKQISFSCQGLFCLSVSYEEAIIWNLASGCAAHRLALHTDVSIKQGLFLPGSNCVLVCFQDDTMNVWDVETMECVKRIVPNVWKGNHLKTITFTRNGSAMVVGGHSSQLVIFSLDTWRVKNCIPLPDHMGGVKHIEFLSQEFDAGANKVLALLSTNCRLSFLAVETECFMQTNLSQDVMIQKFACSPTGRYVAAVLHSGEVNIYQSSQLLKVSESSGKKLQDKNGVARRTFGRRSHGRQQRLLEQQMKEKLQVQRLQPLLKQFGEFPDSYRSLIWRTVLQLPCNQAAFISLVNRDCHPAYRDIDRAFPQETRTVVKNLRRVLSCLVLWCPLFAEVKYLPYFALPFVTLFQNNPLDCFELLVTIIINWCQHWFEYFPYPPVNVLSMVHNILQQHDRELLQFLYDHDVTSELYAWSILQTGFSQVLSEKEWRVLWDHVLSNEPCFLLMAVVAYNIVCRGAIKSCRSPQDFQLVYKNRNAIDMKRFLSKCYHLSDATSEDVHPRQYFHEFQALESGIYPVFTSYSKCTIDHQIQLLENIRAENEQLANEYRAAMEWEAERNRNRNRYALQEQHEERLRCAEEALRAEVLKEALHVAQQRQKVVKLNKELHAQELEMLQETSDRISCRSVQLRQASLDKALDLIKLKSCSEEAMLSSLEQEVRNHLDHMKMMKLQQELAAAGEPGNSTVSAVDQKPSMAKQGRDIQSSIAMVEQLMEQVNQELIKEGSSSQHSEQMAATAYKVRQLEGQTKLLEAEVQQLLEKLSKRRQHDAPATMVDKPKQAPHHRQDVLHGDSLSQKGHSVRSWDLYHKEKQAIKNAMISREKLLNAPNISRRHFC